jgi:hypothetical protein
MDSFISVPPRSLALCVKAGCGQGRAVAPARAQLFLDGKVSNRFDSNGQSANMVQQSGKDCGGGQTK